METEDQNVHLVEYALQHYDATKYDSSGMWSILYQYAIEKFPHIFFRIKLYLSAPYSIREKNVEALLLIKVENPEIE